MRLECLIFPLGCILFLSSCGGRHAGGPSPHEETVPDTLRAVTLYGPTSYFDYRGEKMGFDYENVKRFAEDENLVLDLRVAPSLQALLKMMSDGEAQLAAFPVPLIDEYKRLVRHCGYREVTWQVLVQPASDERISDVTQLVGKSVYVEKDSKYHFRLQNLNNELGGGIDIRPISRDSLITEDLIRMVSSGEIPLTVVDSDIASLNKSYYPGLDVDMKISFDQYSSWAVAQGLDTLAEKIDSWEKRKGNSEMVREIYKKYFEISKNPAPYEDPEKSLGLKMKRGGRISPYDELFRRYARLSGYDWRLLASIAFNESRFTPGLVSWAGACGIMQLMPSTAEAMGIETDALMSPDHNIMAAARLLRKLDSSFAGKVEDPEERIKFVVAAYNCGTGHIRDAMALADKYGLDSQKWHGNVRETALLKSRPRFYNDPVVRNGYFRGRETAEFVDRVMSVFDYFRKYSQ